MRSACDSRQGRRAAMGMFAGLDVGGKQTAICIVDEAGKIAWHGMVDTHPDMIAGRLGGLSGEDRSGWHREQIRKQPFAPGLTNKIWISVIHP